MTSLAEAFGLGRGCFGREGVLRCTGTFPETGGMMQASLGKRSDVINVIHDEACRLIASIPLLVYLLDLCFFLLI